MCRYIALTRIASIYKEFTSQIDALFHCIKDKANKLMQKLEKLIG